MTTTTALVTPAVLQRRLVGFVRAFGLHQPERTPCGQPLPVSEAHALLELDADQPLTQQELGTRLRLQKSTVSRLVDSLERRGWLHRSAHPSDGRAILLRLTTEGSATAEAIARARETKFSQLLGAIPADERETVLHALTVLTEALDG